MARNPSCTDLCPPLRAQRRTRCHVARQCVEPNDARHGTVVANVEVVAGIVVIIPRTACAFDPVFFRPERGNLGDRIGRAYECRQVLGQGFSSEAIDDRVAHIAPRERHLRKQRGNQCKHECRAYPNDFSSKELRELVEMCRCASPAAARRRSSHRSAWTRSSVQQRHDAAIAPYCE